MNRHSRFAAALVMLLCTMSAPLSAEGLVSPSAAARLAEKARPVERGVARERAVDVDFRYLELQATARGGAISVELFDGMTIAIDAESLEQRGVGNYTVSGRIRGYGRSSAVLTVVDGFLAAHLTLGETPGPSHGAVWRIQGADGRHWLQEIDPDAFPIDHPSGSELLRAPPAPKSDGDDARADVGAAADAGDTIDLMVVYTNQTAAAAGAAIGSHIQSAVDVANQSYARSNIGTRLRLVHYAHVAYDESGDFYTELSRLTSTSDGFMDTAHSLRNTHAADLVSLFVENGSYCGMAWIGATATYAFSVVNRGCAASNYTLAHELGHNFGARHDPYVDGATTPYAYGHGHVNVSGAWRTIMAYNNACADAGVGCARIGYFSNPNVTYGGMPTGTSTTSDNARVHNATAYAIANFRTSGSAGCSYSLSPSSVTMVAAGGTGSTGVSTGTGCAWNARSNASWLGIATGSGTSGSGTLYFSVTPNAGTVRTGTVSVGDKTLTVAQGTGCTFAIAPGSTTVGASGVTGTVSVTAASGCGWTATSAASWLSVTGGASGSGNGTVSYAVAPNTGLSRASNLAIADKTFGVTQSAATNTAAASMSPLSLNYGNVQVGRSSASKVATFSNTGNVALSIVSLATSGANSTDFLRSGTCAVGMTLQGGQSCTISHVFAPTGTGTRTATGSVTTAAGTHSVALSGNGKPARGQK